MNASKKRRTLVAWILVMTLLASGVCWLGWDRYASGSWTTASVTVDLPPNEDVSVLRSHLEQALPPEGSRVLQHLDWRGWEIRLKPGRYTFDLGETVKESAVRLVTGNREAVRVVVPSGRDVGPIAGGAARHVFADSAKLAEWLVQDSVMWRVLPNTYEMWWETDAEALVDRLLREHQLWWNEDRVAAARAQGLTPKEATVLASIVQAETAALDEAPTVAGLYLNRLNKGMALQADPTLIYALGDPSIRRVLDVHKDIESPYNTYKYRGLPPGPIRFVDPRYIQSVLHPASHRHLYMCAEPGGTGTHRFASSYREHLRNARDYQAWLNQQRIFR